MCNKGTIEVNMDYQIESMLSNNYRKSVINNTVKITNNLTCVSLLQFIHGYIIIKTDCHNETT